MLAFAVAAISANFAGVQTKTAAIVLRSVRYGDGRLIVDMFTRECGRMSFIVPVSRRGGSRSKARYFQPTTILDVECDVRPRLQLQRLGEARLLFPYSSLPFSAVKVSLSLFVAEFLCYALRGEQRNEPLFDYIADSLRWLDGCESGFANFHLVFLMRLSRFLGFYPNLEGYAPGCCFDLRASCFCASQPPHGDFLAPIEASKMGLMMRMNYSTMRLFAMSRAERNRLLDVIVAYYRIHLPAFPEPRSLAVLRELFA